MERFKLCDVSMMRDGEEEGGIAGLEITAVTMEIMFMMMS